MKIQLLCEEEQLYFSISDLQDFFISYRTGQDR